VTRYEAPDQIAPEASLQRPRGGRAWHIVAGFVVVFLGGSLLLWFLRKPVAEQALAAWCGDRDLTCDAKFTELETSGVTISAVKVSAGTAVPAEATEVKATVRWTGLFTPVVTGVTVNGLSLRGTLDGEGLRFGGLERLVQAGGGGGTAPPVEIRDARVLLETPAGLAGATLNVSGNLPRNGTVTLKLDPGELGILADRADLRDARLDVRAVDGKLDAELGIGLNQAALLGYGLEEFELLSRAEFDLDEGKPAAIEWSLRASRIAAPEVRVVDIRTSGRAEFAVRPEPNLEAALNALTGAVFDAEAENVSWNGYSVEIARLEGELSGSEGEVSGPLILTTGNASGKEGTVAEMSVAGELLRRKASSTVFDGKISVSGASLKSGLRREISAAFSLPGVLEGHVEGLRAALDRALVAFGADAEVRIQTDGKAAVIEGTGPADLSAASGLSVRITPDEGAPWLRAGAGMLSVAGNIVLSGGGAPSAALDVNTFALGRDAMMLDAETFRLDPWTVGGRSLAADLRDLRLDSKPEKLTLAGAGLLSFAGDAAGVQLARTTITGGLDAVLDQAGWRVQSAGAPCLAVDTAGMAIGAISLEAAHVDVCPVNGRFMRQGPVPGGSANLGKLNLPFTMESGSGALILDGTAIDWTVGKALSLSLRAGDLNLPLTIGERTLTIAGADPRIDLETGKGPARIAARLGATVFGGTMIPANVSARAFTFDGMSAVSGVEGKVAGSGVRVTDTLADPLYEPISADFTGTLGNNRLLLTAPLLLKQTGTAIADASVDINIVTLDGSASVVSRPLAFRPDGLQPDMISDRLTGLFTDASGSMSGDARFVIDGGDIAGTADIRVQNFGFQTTRLGRVTGINGDIVFADLMSLRTAPDQFFTLASINPGIPLSSGRIAFDLEDGVLHLDSVKFPFGGGTLAVAPFDWALEGGLQDQSVAVTADAIDLSRLVEILKLPDTQATGTVSGTFPIVFTGNRVEIKDARLKADEPGGRLSYTGGAVGAASSQDANAGLAFDALRDLKFKVLEIGINGDLTGQMRADLLLAGENVNPLAMGKNLTLPAGQAFEFAIGFDVPLGKLLEQNLGLVSQQDVIDATVELLKAETPEKPESGMPSE
jgi:hypothetical protein